MDRQIGSRLDEIPALSEGLGAECLRALTTSARSWRSGDHHAGLDDALRVLMKLPRTPSLLRAEANYWASRHLCALGNFDQSVECTDEALAMGEDILSIDLRCSLLASSAFALSELGDSERGLSRANEGLALAREHHLLEQESVALVRVGLCLSRMGETDRAELQLLLALSLARETHAAHEVFAALTQLVGATMTRCEQLKDTNQELAFEATLARAKLYAQQAVAMASRSGEASKHVAAMNNQGKVYALAGEWSVAEAIFRRVAEEANDQGLLLLSMRASYNLGGVLNTLGRHAEALSELRSLLARLDIVDHVPLRKVSELELERSYRALGLNEDALKSRERYASLVDPSRSRSRKACREDPSLLAVGGLSEERVAELAKATIARLSRIEFSASTLVNCENDSRDQTASDMSSSRMGDTAPG